MAWPLRFARRVRAVEGRCSSGARIVLDHYATYEDRFEELIELLEHMRGRIAEEDVINALAHIKMSRRSGSPVAGRVAERRCVPASVPSGNPQRPAHRAGSVIPLKTAAPSRGAAAASAGTTYGVSFP